MNYSVTLTSYSKKENTLSKQEISSQAFLQPQATAPRAPLAPRAPTRTITPQLLLLLANSEASALRTSQSLATGSLASSVKPTTLMSPKPLTSLQHQPQLRRMGTSRTTKRRRKRRRRERVLTPPVMTTAATTPPPTTRPATARTKRRKRRRRRQRKTKRTRHKTNLLRMLLEDSEKHLRQPGHSIQLPRINSSKSKIIKWTSWT